MYGRVRRLKASRAATVIVVLGVSTASLVYNGASSHRAAAAKSPPAWAAGRTGTYLLSYNNGPATLAEAPRRRVVVLSAWEHPYIARIRAANPDVLVLVYKDLSSTRERCSSDNDSLPTGVDYCYANSTHPEWFLTDQSGQRFRYDAYPDHWQMDVGNADYQQTWLANVRSNLAARGWDGVFTDNALSSADDYHPSVYPARYPSHASFQDAYRSILKTVGSGLRAAGFLTIANISNARLYRGLWGSYLADVDGGFEEWFVDWSDTPGTYTWDSGDSGWKAQVDQIAETAAAGKLAMVRAGSTSPSQDPDGFRYALASYLLAKDGRSLFGFGYDIPYEPRYDWDLGAALGSYYTLGNSVYRRDFSAGVVVVNAAQSSSATIALGNSYRDENGNLVASVALGAQRAAILRGPSAPRPAPPTTRSPAPPQQRSPAPLKPVVRPPGRTTTSSRPRPPATSTTPETAGPAESGSQGGTPPLAEQSVPGSEVVHDSQRAELAEQATSTRSRRAQKSNDVADARLLALLAIGPLAGIGALGLRRRARRTTGKPG